MMKTMASRLVTMDNGLIHNPILSHRMGPPSDSVQLPSKWLNSMVYGRYNYR